MNDLSKALLLVAEQIGKAASHLEDRQREEFYRGLRLAIDLAADGACLPSSVAAMSDAELDRLIHEQARLLQ